MATTVRFTVLTGPHKNRKFCFCGPNQCQVGRALDCFIRLVGSERDELISRRHCQLEIDPPMVRVRDLGSTNGTFLNGREIESSADEASAATTASPVKDGDLLTVGGTTFRVNIVDCPHAHSERDETPAWKDGQTALADCPVACA